MINQRPILVTGAHRSGTTWLGKMLSQPWSVRYISEPFNPKTGLRIFQRWFQYLTEETGRPYRREISRLLKFRGRFRPSGPAFKYWLNNFQPGQKRPLIKDPIACLSAGWLSDQFQCQTVVIVRHPAAFYLSLKRLNWRFDFGNFLSQPALMRDFLNPFRREMLAAECFPEEAAVLWKCLYFVLDALAESHPDWLVCRHQDLARTPEREIHRLYRRLGLNFTPEISRKISKYCQAGRVAARPNRALELKRDSQKLADSWKDRLSRSEIEILKKITAPVAEKYYSNSDW